VIKYFNKRNYNILISVEIILVLFALNHNELRETNEISWLWFSHNIESRLTTRGFNSEKILFILNKLMKIGDYLKQRLTGYGGNFADIFYAVILG